VLNPNLKSVYHSIKNDAIQSGNFLFLLGREVSKFSLELIYVMLIDKDKMTNGEKVYEGRKK